jgi:hypothetical protein
MLLVPTYLVPTYEQSIVYITARFPGSKSVQLCRMQFPLLSLEYCGKSSKHLGDLAAPEQVALLQHIIASCLLHGIIQGRSIVLHAYLRDSFDIW